MMTTPETKKSTKNADRHECQICEGHFKTKKGLMVHHGYKRPGDGFIHGDCMGVGHAPYKATDALEAYLVMLEGMLSSDFAAQSRLNAHDPIFTKIEEGVYSPELAKRMGERTVWVNVLVDWAPMVSEPYAYKKALDSKRAQAARRVSSLVKEVARVRARIEAAKA